MGDAADDAERRALAEHEEEPMGDGADDARDAEELAEMTDRPDPESMTVALLKEELHAENARRRAGATDGVYLMISPEGKKAELVARVQQLRNTKHDPENAAAEVDPDAEDVDGEIVEETEGEPEAQAEAEGAPEKTLAEVEADEAKMMLERYQGPPPSVLPGSSEWNTALTVVEAVVDTEFVPRSYRGRPDAVVAAYLAGREIGIGLMASLRQIHMIDGRPAFAAELLLAVIRRRGVIILESESTGQRAFIRARRSDTGEEAAVEWTMEEADRAGLTSKQNWRSYPTDMLWSRCVGRLARRLASDFIIGMPYTAEEVADFDLEIDTEPYTPIERGTVRETRKEGAKVETPRTWAEIFAWAEPYGPEIGWAEWVRDCSELLFKTRDRSQLDSKQLTTLGQKASGAVIALRDAHEPGQVPPPGRADVQKAWAKVLDGIALPGPDWRMGADEDDRQTYWDATGTPEPGAPEPDIDESESAEDTPADDAGPVDANGDEIEWPEAPDHGYA